MPLKVWIKNAPSGRELLRCSGAMAETDLTSHFTLEHPLKGVREIALTVPFVGRPRGSTVRGLQGFIGFRVGDPFKENEMEDFDHYWFSGTYNTQHKGWCTIMSSDEFFGSHLSDSMFPEMAETYYKATLVNQKKLRVATHCASAVHSMIFSRLIEANPRIESSAIGTAHLVITDHFGLTSAMQESPCLTHFGLYGTQVRDFRLQSLVTHLSQVEYETDFTALVNRMFDKLR